MYKIIYERTSGLYEAIVGAESKEDASKLLKNEIKKESREEIIKIIEVYKLRGTGVMETKFIDKY